MAVSDDVKAALQASNKFKIVGQTEQGANSYSFRAVNTVLGRDEFLKIFYYTEAAAAEVLTEPRTLVQATQAAPVSENVVQLFDGNLISVGSDLYVCLQMEYVDGPSLLTSLNNDGPFGQQDSIRIISGILSGLSNLHSKRIVHRDLKPANVVLKQQTPKITDFGSAVVLTQDQNEVPASKHSSLYVPPEGWQMPSVYSFQSDIYQSSMILYELINGQLTYEMAHYITPSLHRELKKQGKTLQDLDEFDKSKIADRGIADLSFRQQLLEYGRDPQPYLSDKIRRIIKIGTHPELSKRFASADALIAKLSQIQVPNWRPISDTLYRAPSWRNWDWEISAAKDAVLVRKSQPGLNSFRKVQNCKVTSLRGAFEFVEEA